MSNYLAIATVSEALRSLLTPAAQAIPGGEVFFQRPDRLQDDASLVGINVFLVHSSMNSHWRNDDLPSRNGNGNVVRRPQAALDLHYLLTFLGGTDQLVPQQLMGAATRELHARPIVSRELIAELRSSATEDSFLANTDLDQQIDQVRLTPQPLNLEELSKLWSVFLQTPYMLSMSYMASAVLIEADVISRAPSLPVRRRSVTAVPLRDTVIEEAVIEETLAPNADSGQPPTVQQRVLVLRGQQLSATTTLLQIDDEPLENDGGVPALETVTNREIRTRDLSELTAGIHAAQVIHPVSITVPAGEGEPELQLQRNVFVSNSVAFQLAPRIVFREFVVEADGRRIIRIQVSPDLTEQQRVVLLLNGQTASPQAYSLLDPPPPPSPPPAVPPPLPVDEREFDVSGVSDGTYYIRVQVDGAQSPLMQPTDPSQPIGPANPPVHGLPTIEIASDP